MTDKFNTYLGEVDFDSIRRFCIENGELRQYAKGEAFAEEGRICRNFGFVHSGYFKYSTINSAGMESVANFAFENEYIADFKKSFHGLPSVISIVAGMASEAYVVPLHIVKSLFFTNESDAVHYIYKALFNQCYSRLLTLYQSTPTDRYLALLKEYPQIISEVALKDIASFLLITPNHLSRIRRKLSSENGKK